MIKKSTVLAMVLAFVLPRNSAGAQTAPAKTAPVPTLPAQATADGYPQKLQPVLEKLIHESDALQRLKN